MIEAARGAHPLYAPDGRAMRGGSDREPASRERRLQPPPEGVTVRLRYDAGGLAEVRRFIRRFAAERPAAVQAVEDLVVAVNELAANSVIHGGGGGSLTAWREGGMVVCEISDLGHISDPDAGRRRPDPHAPGGRGLWLTKQLCDLFQIRSSPSGTTIRVSKRIDQQPHGPTSRRGV